MGWLRKKTGAQQQTDALYENARVAEAATKQAAAGQIAQLQQSARAAADNQAMVSARNAAEAKASDAAAQPLATADVALSAPQEETVTAGRAKRRASYGKNYSSGVSI
jgi:hypothetical protein